MLKTKTFQTKMEKKGLWTMVKPLVEQANVAGAPGREDMWVFVELLDKALAPKECLAVTEELGCCKTQKKPHRDFYKKYADKTLEERISLMDEIDSPHKAPTVLNDDHTLSVFWAFGEENHYTCVCSCKMMREVKTSGQSCVSSTFCACCGGHVKELWQTALGIKLKLKQVVSSVVCTDGRKWCEFLFDIED